MKSLHDRTVDAIATAIRTALDGDDDHLVFTHIPWESLEGFPELVELLDIAVVPIQRQFDRSKPPYIGPLTSVTTIIDVLDAESLDTDFYHRHDYLTRSCAQEHLLFDPTGELMRPALQGFRQDDTGLERLSSCHHGVFFSSGKYRLVFAGGEVNGVRCDTFREEELFEECLPSLKGATARELHRVLSKNAKVAKRDPDE